MKKDKKKAFPKKGFLWSGRQGSNLRHSAWKADTLPTELRPHTFEFYPSSLKTKMVAKDGFEPSKG
jgi:hypothetical protein